MKRQSIFFTITVSFIISILLVVISFIILMTHNYKLQERQLFGKYAPIIQMVLRQHHIKKSNINLIKSLKEINYTLFSKIGHINAITYNPHTKILIEKTHKKRQAIFRVLQLNNSNYIYMKKGDNEVLIKDNTNIDTNNNLYIILVFCIVIITIILMYIITLRKIMPLKILKDKVKNLGDEDFDFECCDSKAQDEVTLLGMEFKKTALKLKSLKEARNIFIRNIMHELKTPITKGKFLAQLEQNEVNNEKMKSVFNRLELLINEFASIEELISSNKNIEKNFYFLDDIIDNAQDILILDDNIMINKYENKKLHVNFKLFSIAIKNLLDNAIKYSDDKKVTIKTNNEDIVFENKGAKLKYDLEKYFEPFFANEDKSKDSFGLGLYIVYNILKANDYELVYEYIDGINRFICKKRN